MGSNVSKATARKLYEKYEKSESEIIALKNQLEDFRYSDQFIRNENSYLREENRKLIVERNILTEEIRAGKTNLSFKQTVNETPLEKEFYDLKPDCNSSIEVVVKPEKGNDPLVEQLKKLTQQNEVLHRNITELEERNSSLENSAENFLENYFTTQCFEALEGFNECDQNILTWTLQYAFDPAKASAQCASSFKNAKNLRINCMAKAQFDKYARSFDVFLQNTKAKQFKTILALHKNFTYDLNELRENSHDVFTAHQEQLQIFKAETSQNLNHIKQQFENINSETNKFLENFANQTLNVNTPVHNRLLNRVFENLKYTEEFRLPVMKLAISSLSSVIEKFQLTPLQTNISCDNFLNHFKRLEKSL